MSIRLEDYSTIELGMLSLTLQKFTRLKNMFEQKQND